MCVYVKSNALVILAGIQRNITNLKIIAYSSEKEFVTLFFLGFHLQLLFLYLNSIWRSRGRVKPRPGTKWDDTKGLRTVGGGCTERATYHKERAPRTEENRPRRNTNSKG